MLHSYLRKPTALDLLVFMVKVTVSYELPIVRVAVMVDVRVPLEPGKLSVSVDPDTVAAAVPEEVVTPLQVIAEPFTVPEGYRFLVTEGLLNNLLPEPIMSSINAFISASNAFASFITDKLLVLAISPLQVTVIGLP